MTQTTLFLPNTAEKDSGYLRNRRTEKKREAHKKTNCILGAYCGIFFNNLTMHKQQHHIIHKIVRYFQFSPILHAFTIVFSTCFAFCPTS